MARKATWQHHADPREWVSGIAVTYILYIYYIGYRKYKPSIEDIANLLGSPHIIYPILSLQFLCVGLLIFFHLVFRQHGSIQRVNSISRGTLHVNHMESGSTRSLITHVVKRILSEVIRTSDREL